VHGFDLTFAAPKSVSLVRALGNDVAEKTVAAAHEWRKAAYDLGISGDLPIVGK
jgi:hypothetical protein